MNVTPRTRPLWRIPVNGAVITLGYFQASLAFAAILVVIREGVVSLYHLINGFTHGYYNEKDDRTVLKRTSLISLALLFLGLCLTLAIFLIYGAKKRRPFYVLAYFIFGVLTVLGLGCYWVVRLYDDPYNFAFEGAIEIFLALVAYSPCLVLVYLLYRNIKLERQSEEEQGLIYNMLLENDRCAHDVEKLNHI